MDNISPKFVIGLGCDECVSSLVQLNLSELQISKKRRPQAAQNQTVEFTNPTLLLECLSSVDSLWKRTEAALTYNKSIKNTKLTVCSERLILINSWPEALAMAPTRLVFPTPGEPSRRMGRDN